MDTQMRRDLETMAERRAYREAMRRLGHRLHFWINVHQVVYEPTVTVPTPGIPDIPCSVPGVGSGAAGSKPPDTPRRFAGEAGPGRALFTSPPGGTETPGPARPHLNPPLATRISAGITFN